MTPPEIKELNQHLQAVAEILFRNTPPENRQNFESIERTLRQQILTSVAPTLGSFFLKPPAEPPQVEPEK
jgi:hypothetical protein